MPEANGEKYMVIFQPSGRRGFVEKGKNLKEASVQLGVDLEGVCGEIAICGKCKIKVNEGHFEKYGIVSSRENLAPMGRTEKKFFNLKQEREGFRLACQAPVLGDVVVFVPEESRMGKQIVRKAAKELDDVELKPAVKKYYVELPKATLEDSLGDWERLQNALNDKYNLSGLCIDYQVLLGLQNTIRKADWNVTVTVWMDKEVIKVEAGEVKKVYGLAVDVGSTTVAGYLSDLTDGSLVATASMMNPQVIYGEDVMSRISYSMTNPDGLKQLNQAIIDGLNGIIDDISRQVGIKGQDIVDMTIVGNTCQHHLSLNLDPNYIGKAPFPPALHSFIDVKARDFGLFIPPELEKKDIGNASPCHANCPAGIDGQDFLYLIAQGKHAEALELVRETMPFAGVCGRVCTHPCESVCERKEVDEPLSIRSLHRYIADYSLKEGLGTVEPLELDREETVAVIGSGPAGLSCAYDLVRKGYAVTVFEALPEAGGMLRYGIPAYRLPNDILDHEINYIKGLGVEIKTNTPVKNLQSLFDEGYNAIFLGSGAWLSQSLAIKNEDATGVMHALDFLKQVNSGENVEIGKKVVVIGGGNAAIDAARVAKRLGADEVSVVYRRTQDEMPAISTEVEEAQLEGINMVFLAAPAQILAENNRVTGVECLRMELGEPDESGRPKPVPVQGSEFQVDADNVIIAIGQLADKAGLVSELEYTEKQTVSVNPKTMSTNIKGVFAGGDVVSGPSDVVGAVCAGQEAAISIELFFQEIDLEAARPEPLHVIEEIPKEGVETEARQVLPMLEEGKRQGFVEVELGFSEEAAMQESKRCLNCSVFAEEDEPEMDTRGFGINLSPGAYIHNLPIEAGFVGADNVGVLIAEAPYNVDEMVLIIDIGTNGELIMGNKQKLISSSCATGPAFEGAEIKYGMRAAPGAIEKIEINRETKEVRFKIIDNDKWNTEMEEPGAKGMCGSAIIDVVPQLFMAEIIDKTGRFRKDLEHPRYRITDGVAEYVIAWAKETSINQDIVICQDDIRAIQLAKGAMYAGAKIMMRALGIEKLDKVILAGAFGSYIDRESAAVMGLFPDCNLENVYAVGNAAGDGARIALHNIETRAIANVEARKVEYIELTLSPDFDKIFSQAMWLPHMKDKFPNLVDILPKKK